MSEESDNAIVDRTAIPPELKRSGFFDDIADNANKNSPAGEYGDHSTWTFERTQVDGHGEIQGDLKSGNKVIGHIKQVNDQNGLQHFVYTQNGQDTQTLTQNPYNPSYNANSPQTPSSPGTPPAQSGASTVPAAPAGQPGETPNSPSSAPAAASPAGEPGGYKPSMQDLSNAWEHGKLRGVQRLLTHAGLYDGPIDGEFGGKSQKGLMDYVREASKDNPEAAKAGAGLTKKIGEIDPPKSEDGKVIERSKFDEPNKKVEDIFDKNEDKALLKANDAPRAWEQEPGQDKKPRALPVKGHRLHHRVGGMTPGADPAAGAPPAANHHRKVTPPAKPNASSTPPLH